MNIYEKMSAVTESIKTIPKNLTVGTGKNQYKAVAEKDILEAVKQQEKAHGIFSFPFDRKIIQSFEYDTKTDYGDKKTYFIRMETIYRFINMEKPDEFIDIKGYGDGIDTLDKAPGKAATYSDKYALMKAYKIETGDDLDANASDDLSGHDIFKIKKRIEQIFTEKLQNGMAEKDVLSRLSINEKQLESIFSYFGKISNFEKMLKSL